VRVATEPVAPGGRFSQAVRIVPGLVLVPVLLDGHRTGEAMVRWDRDTGEWQLSWLWADRSAEGDLDLLAKAVPRLRSGLGMGPTASLDVKLIRTRFGPVAFASSAQREAGILMTWRGPEGPFAPLRATSMRPGEVYFDDQMLPLLEGAGELPPDLM
jgi:hypothetical protein